MSRKKKKVNSINRNKIILISLIVIIIIYITQNWDYMIERNRIKIIEGNVDTTTIPVELKQMDCIYNDTFCYEMNLKTDYSKSIKRYFGELPNGYPVCIVVSCEEIKDNNCNENMIHLLCSKEPLCLTERCTLRIPKEKVKK